MSSEFDEFGHVEIRDLCLEISILIHINKAWFPRFSPSCVITAYITTLGPPFRFIFEFDRDLYRATQFRHADVD